MAQALYWFDTDTLFDNVQSGGVLTARCYAAHQINDSIDVVVEIVRPLERRLVERRYRDISFPFETCFEQNFFMNGEWNLPQLCGYLAS